MKTNKNKTRNFVSKKKIKKERIIKTRKISRTTEKKESTKKEVQGKIISEKEGWKVVEVRGTSFEMGYAHGNLLSKELREVYETFQFVIKEDLKIPFSQYLEKSNALIKPVIKSNYPEIYQELKGISEGAKDNGTNVSVDFLISWNSYMSLYSIFEKGSIENKNININSGNKNNHRCSAFIATGSATQNGDIVMAHNTHSTFIEGRFMNIIMYLRPTTGTAFMMQMSPGFVSSISDWFICESGIIGCETTIAYTNYKPSFGNPAFCRIRQAMQYANSLDKYAEIMLDGNAGDYACSWQFGNVNTGEIMLLELGLEKYNIQRTMNGVYYGMNSAIDWSLRKIETDDHYIFDPKAPTGSRNIRLNYLLNDKYYGKINTENAKAILSDHYDMSLGKSQMNGRSICKHSEQDSSIAYMSVSPIGCVDGKVVNTIMAKKMEFLGRFGSSCNRHFSKKAFLKKHPEYKKLDYYLRDFPTRKWIHIKN
jgi:hypothetical protein